MREAGTEMIRELEMELYSILVLEKKKHGEVSGSPLRKTLELVTVSGSAGARPERRKLPEIS